MGFDLEKNRRRSDNPLYNKLNFNGYHVHGTYDGSPFLDSYPTLEQFYKSFHFAEDNHVFSAREIYLICTHPSCGEEVEKIVDNSGKVLWSPDMELDFQARSA